MAGRSRGAEREGFEPSRELAPPTRLAGECLQPLGHLSGEPNVRTNADTLGRRMSPMPADPEALRARYDEALADVTPPFAFVDLDALRANAAQMLRQSGRLPIRVASKSIRSLPVLRRIFALDERFQGILSFTLR